MKKNILIIFLSCAYVSILGQQDSTSSFREVRIEEKRLTDLPFAMAPRNIQIIQREEIKAMPAQSIAEVLTWVAGVDLRQRGP